MFKKVIRRTYRELSILFISPFLFVNQTPIIVLGNQKSGTTVIAALLAQYGGLSVTLDIRGIYEPAQTKLHKGDLTFAEFVRRNKHEFSRDIIKEPCLTFLYPSIVDEFPEAKFVMVIRDPRDNIRSILNRLQIPGDLGNLDSHYLDAIRPEWRLTLDGRWLGLTGSNYIEMLAARWNLAADIYRQNSDDGILLIRYEDFVADKIGVIASLAHKLRLSQKNDIAEKVDIQYQPRGNRNISWEDFFGAENLYRIERICANNMRIFNYYLLAGKSNGT